MDGPKMGGSINGDPTKMVVFFSWKPPCNRKYEWKILSGK
jgi:hypothetical protein